VAGFRNIRGNKREKGVKRERRGGREKDI